MRALVTIGYEGADLADFVDTLIEAGVDQVVDIRALPQSRRPGFSKKALSAALEAAGIGYQHVRELGDPKEGRDAARSGDIARFQLVFLAHLAGEPAQIALEHLTEQAGKQNCALLCYERDHRFCHRAIVADHMAALSSLKVNHLGVAQGLRRRRVNGAGVSDARDARAC